MFYSFLTYWTTAVSLHATSSLLTGKDSGSDGMFSAPDHNNDDHGQQDEAEVGILDLLPTRINGFQAVTDWLITCREDLGGYTICTGL